MNGMKQDIARMQEFVGEAFSATGTLAALPDSASPEKLQKALEEVSGTFERSALELRRLCEKRSPGVGGYGKRPVLPRMETSGFVEQFGYGWLHIQLNTLLPHCRYQPPEWLSDTIRRLLDDYEAGGSKLPFFHSRGTTFHLLGVHPRKALKTETFPEVKGPWTFKKSAFYA